VKRSQSQKDKLMKDTMQEIADFINSLFDVSGLVEHPEHGTVIIAGLESTPERNLDDFGRQSDEIKLPGFEKYMAPLLEKAIDYIRGKGYTAELVGRHGYPLRGQLNLKELAIQSGIGKRGKNSVVLHDEYGARLRFAAIKTGTSFQLPARSNITELQNPTCQNCSLCLEVCPVNIIEPYRITDISQCLSQVMIMEEQHGQLIPCDRCLKVCPAGTD
jgi:ferredoxin